MEIVRREVLKPKPLPDCGLGFGNHFTDYMFVMRYDRAQGWHGAEIVPEGPVKFSLATSVLHYAQGVFEGMKAFRRADGSVAVFRPEENWARMLRSAERMCIPAFPVDVVREGLLKLLRLERDWVPREEGCALYIRPTIVATSPRLGVHSADEFLFFILLSPVGSYLAGPLQPVTLLAEDFYVRAPVGGTGEAKCLGNYAASLYATEAARAKGFDQVLWLDAVSKRYAEEVGAMNIFFSLGGKIVTPALDGAILSGITRKSCLELLRAEGIEAEERRVSMEELEEAAQRGGFEEAFGTGTAAVVTPVSTISYRGKTFRPLYAPGKIARHLYETLAAIRLGTKEDAFGWMTSID